MVDILKAVEAAPEALKLGEAAAAAGGDELGKLALRGVAPASAHTMARLSEHFRKANSTGGFLPLNMQTAIGDLGTGQTLYIPKTEAVRPDYLGPFPQLFTYLGVGEAVSDNPAVQIAVDIIGDTLTDPLTYILAGGSNFLPNRWARIAKAVSLATEGGKTGQTGRAALAGSIRALRSAGAIAGNEGFARRMLALAEDGTKASMKEIKALADDLLKVADEDLPDDIRLLVQGLKKDPHALVAISNLGRDEKLGGKLLDKRFFLGQGTADMVRRGQVNSLVSFTHPLSWISTRYRDATFLEPLSHAIGGPIGSVIDTVTGGRKFSRGVPVAVPNKAEALKGADRAMLAVGAGYRKASPAQSLYLLKSQMDFINHIAVAGSGANHMTSRWGQADWDVLKAIPQEIRDVYSDDDIVKMVNEGRLKAQAAERRSILAARERRFADFVSGVRTRGLEAGFPEKTVEEHVAGFESAYKVFDTKEMHFSADEIAHGYVARVSAANQSVENLQYHLGDLIRRVQPGVDEHAVRSLMGSMLNNPEAFSGIDDAGRVLLTGKSAEGRSARLNEILEEHPELAGALDTVGLAPELGDMVKMLRESQEQLGKALVDHGFIEGFVDNYLSQAIDLKTGAKIAGKTREDVIRDAYEKGLIDNFGDLVDRIRLSGGEGRVSATQMRKATDDYLFEGEKLGLWTVRRDALDLWGAYVTSVNKTLTLNGLAMDGVRLSPRVPKEWMKGIKLADGATPNVFLDDAGMKALFKTSRAAAGRYKAFTLTRRRGIQPGAADDLAGLAARGVSASESNAAGRKFAERKLQQEGKLRAAAKGARKPKSKLLDTIVGDSKLVNGRSISHRDLVKWARRGLPKKGITNRSDFQRRWNQFIRQSEGEAAAVVSKGRLKGQAAEMGREAYQPVLYVHEEAWSMLEDAFNIKTDDLVGEGKWLKGLHAAFRAVKSFMLLGDIFHYNVLSYAQMAAMPGVLQRRMVTNLMADERTKLPAILNAAVAAGAAGGAATMTDDPAAIGLAGLAGALYGRSLRAARLNAIDGRFAMLNPAHAETLAWMARGGATGRPNYHAIGMVEKFLHNVAQKAAAGAYPWLPKEAARFARGAARGQAKFEREMWAILHQGTKQMYFDTVFWREVGKAERSGKWAKLSKAEVAAEKARIARQVVHVANMNTGGLRMGVMLKNPQIQRQLALIQFAPDYTLSRLGHVAAIFGNMHPAKRVMTGAGAGFALDMAESGYDPHHASWDSVIKGGLVGLAAGRWANFMSKRMNAGGELMQQEALRIYRNAVLGVFTMSNLLNYALTGKWMHENPEGKKMQIAVGRNEAGQDVYMKVGKPHWEAWEAAGIMEKEKYGFPGTRLWSKTHPLVRQSVSVLQNSDHFGAPIYNTDESFWEQGTAIGMYIAKSMVPIMASGAVSEVGRAFEGDTTPSGVATTGLRTLGFTTTKDRRQIHAEQVSADAERALRAPSIRDLLEKK